MKTKIVSLVLVLAVLGIGYNFVFKKDTSNVTEADYKNISYEIEGQLVSLADIGVRYFGNVVSEDFSGDGFIDEAFILSKDNGGSGTFYYIVVALKTTDGYRGTNAVFLGDRIAPQTTEFRGGEIIVNYAVRKPGESMASSPSVGISKYVKLENGRLVEIKK